MYHRPLHASSSRPTAHPGLILLGALLALVVLAAGCSLGSSVTNYIESTDSNLRKRVAVVPFTSAPAKMKERAVALNLAVSQHLGKMGGVVVSDFTGLEAEMDKVPRTIVNPEDRAIEAGRQMGMNALLTGNITELSVQRMLKGIYGFRDNTPFLTLEVELRLVDVTTGIVVGQEAFKTQGRLDDTVAEAIEGGGQPDDKLVSKLLAEVTKETTSWVAKHVASLPWGGMVLEVDGKRVLVTVGRDTGLPTGSLLSVYALGERIKAGTGQQLALAGPRVGRIKLTELGVRSSWAEIVERASDEKEAKDAKEGKEGKEAMEAKETMEEKPQALTFEVGQWVRTH